MWVLETDLWFFLSCAANVLSAEAVSWPLLKTFLCVLFIFLVSIGVHMWSSENSLYVLGLSSYPVGPGH